MKKLSLIITLALVSTIDAVTPKKQQGNITITKDTPNQHHARRYIGKTNDLQNSYHRYAYRTVPSASPVQNTHNTKPTTQKNNAPTHIRTHFRLFETRNQ